MRAKYSKVLLVALTLLSLNATMVPTNALDLGARGQYIITINPAARASIEAAIGKSGWKIQNKYQYAFDGFTVELPKVAATLLSRIPNVLSIEEDKPVVLFADPTWQSPTPSWGLDRIDQRQKVGLPGSVNSYGYSSAGTGATIYIGDTGIYPHNDFAGRLSSSGYSAISDENGISDCNGHGTHVAGTAAGSKYGIAKNARLVSVRILNCAGSGSFSGVIAGLDWIMSPENPNPKSQAVLNLSIGGNASTSVNNAILRLTNAGITVVAAAGNESTDACTRSPASAPSAITVGATTSGDIPASYSNQGSCVDIFAPGSSITSAWYTGVDATNTINGTSMATPHVAGAAAVYLGLNPSASVAQVSAYLDAQSTKDAISSLKANTVNKLLFVAPGDDGVAPVPPLAALKGVSNITHQSADIAFDINPGGATTGLNFEYATDSAFTTILTAPVTPNPVSGTNAVVANVALTGLIASKTYYFRLTGTNGTGSATSAVGTFETKAPPILAPTVSAGAATNLTAYSATLIGTASGGGATTNVTFVYGTDPEFKVNTNTVAAVPFTVSGTNPTALTLNISFLKGGTTYYFKVVGVNSTGTTHSNVSSFITPVASGKAPKVTTNPNPKSRKVTSAEFLGTINPMGQTTKVQFVWGYEKSLTVGTQTITLPMSPVTGEADIEVSALPIGLIPGRGVYFNFVALNDAGITKGVISYAIMNSETPTIARTYVSANTATGVTLNGAYDVQGSNTRIWFDYSLDPTLASGVTSVQANPFAVASAGARTSNAVITGLKSGTRYFYRFRLVTANGADWNKVESAIAPFETLNVATPTPTPTPTPIVKSPQTITFPALADRSVNGQGTKLLATASSGLPITYTLGISDKCQVLNLGNNNFAIQPIYRAITEDVTICTITANQSGNASFAAATPVSQTLKLTRQESYVNLTTPTAVTDAGVFVTAQPLSRTTPAFGSTVVVRVTALTPTICTTEGLFYPGNGTTRVTVRSRANGTCSVKFDYPGDGYLMASSNTWTTTVSGSTSPAPGSNTAQSIDFPAIPDWQFGPAYRLTATATSKLQVTYRSLTPNVCVILLPTQGASVQSTPGVKVPDRSVCTVEASQTGDDRYAAAAPVTRSFLWVKAPMYITPYVATTTLRNSPLLQTTALTYAAGTTYNFVSSLLFTSGNNSGLASIGHLLRAESVTPTVCSVVSVATQDRTGGIFTMAQVKMLQKSTCTIRWSFDGTDSRGAATRDMSVLVTR